MRVAPHESRFVDPSSGKLARALFGRSGYFMIAGDVVLGGTAQFYLEQGGAPNSRAHWAGSTIAAA